MKQIPIPAPFEITILDVDGAPGKEPDGSVSRISFPRFCRLIILADAFVENLDPIEAAELRLKVKAKLDAVTADTERLLLEDDECTRLQKALKTIRPAPLLAMSCLAFMHAIRDAEKHEPTP
jgi:hypothetical protein